MRDKEIDVKIAILKEGLKNNELLSERMKEKIKTESNILFDFLDYLMTGKA